MMKTEATDHTFPKCGCYIRGGGFKRGTVVYCCEPRAVDCKCDCDCTDETARPERHAPMKGRRRGAA